MVKWEERILTWMSSSVPVLELLINLLASRVLFPTGNQYERSSASYCQCPKRFFLKLFEHIVFLNCQGTYFPSTKQSPSESSAFVSLASINNDWEHSCKFWGHGAYIQDCFTLYAIKGYFLSHYKYLIGFSIAITNCAIAIKGIWILGCSFSRGLEDAHGHKVMGTHVFNLILFYFLIKHNDLGHC